MGAHFKPFTINQRNPNLLVNHLIIMVTYLILQPNLKPKYPMKCSSYQRNFLVRYLLLSSIRRFYICILYTLLSFSHRESIFLLFFIMKFCISEDDGVIPTLQARSRLCGFVMCPAEMAKVFLSFIV